MDFVGNIFGNHLPEVPTVPRSVMVILQKWEFSQEIFFFFSVYPHLSPWWRYPKGERVYISLCVSLSPHLVNSQAAIDLTFNHSSSLCPSPFIWWLTPHLGLCSVHLNGSSLTLSFSDTLCQVPILNRCFVLRVRGEKVGWFKNPAGSPWGNRLGVVFAGVNRLVVSLHCVF